MPPFDFRTSSIQTKQIIATGSFDGTGTRSQIAIYPIEAQGSPPNQGVIDSELEDQLVGDDVFLFVSGAKDSKGASTRGVTVFGGDIHISGNMTIDGSGGGGGGSSGGTSLQTVTQNAHGFTLTNLIPIPVYWDSGTWVEADLSPSSHTKQAFIVEIIDVNTFVVQLHGFHALTPGHGLLDSNYYWLTGSAPYYTATAPTVGFSQCLWVVEGDNLQLLNQAPYNISFTSLPGTVQSNQTSAVRILVPSDTGTHIPLSASANAISVVISGSSLYASAGPALSFACTFEVLNASNVIAFASSSSTTVSYHGKNPNTDPIVAGDMITVFVPSATRAKVFISEQV